MVSVSVGEEDGIKLRQIGERNARRTDSGKEAAQGTIEVGIGEDPLLANLDQECCVTNVRNAHGPYSLARPTSIDFRITGYITCAPALLVSSWRVHSRSAPAAEWQSDSG